MDIFKNLRLVTCFISGFQERNLFKKKQKQYYPQCCVICGKNNNKGYKMKLPLLQAKITKKNVLKTKFVD